MCSKCGIALCSTSVLQSNTFKGTTAVRCKTAPLLSGGGVARCIDTLLGGLADPWYWWGTVAKRREGGNPLERGQVAPPEGKTVPPKMEGGTTRN